MTNIWKRSLSLMLALVMVFGLVPVNAFATENTDDTTTQTTEAPETPVEDPTDAPDMAPESEEDPVQALIDSLPASVNSQEEYDAVYEIVYAIEDNGYELTDEQTEQVLAAMAAADEWFNAELEADVYAEGASFEWKGDTLVITDGPLTKGQLYNALVAKYGSGSYKFAESSSKDWNLHGEAVNSGETEAITLVAGKGYAAKKGGTGLSDWTGWGTKASKYEFTIELAFSAGGGELEVNDKPEMEINGYHTTTDYSARFENVKQNILNAVLKNGATNVDDYNLHIWIDPIAGDARYFNYDDTSLLGDYNLLTVTNPYRFPCADFGDTKFETNLKVKIVENSTGRVVESTIKVTDTR